MSENLPPTTPAHERIKREKTYHALATQSLEHLVCPICSEVVQFPLLFPCQIHVACHLCMHKAVDHRKHSSLEHGEIEPFCMFPIKCSICNKEGHTDENLEKVITRPIGGTMAAVTEMIAEMQKNSSAQSKVRVPMQDDLVCPYCKAEFTTTTSLSARYDHLTSCSARQWTCRCGQVVENMDLHLRKGCKTFKCKECGQQNLSWNDLKEHRSRTSDTSVFCSQVTFSLTNAGKFPAISHQDEWKTLPAIVRRSCELLQRYRTDPIKVLQVMQIFTQTLSQLDALETEWNNQTSRKQWSANRVVGINIPPPSFPVSRPVSASPVISPILMDNLDLSTT